MSLWVRSLRTFDLWLTYKAVSWFWLSQSELRLWRCPPACLHTLLVWRHMLLFWLRFCLRDNLGLSKSLVFELQSHFWLLPLTSDSPLQPETFLKINSELSSTYYHCYQIENILSIDLCAAFNQLIHRCLYNIPKIHEVTL